MHVRTFSAHSARIAGEDPSVGRGPRLGTKANGPRTVTRWPFGATCRPSGVGVEHTLGTYPRKGMGFHPSEPVTNGSRIVFGAKDVYWQHGIIFEFCDETDDLTNGGAGGAGLCVGELGFDRHGHRGETTRPHLGGQCMRAISAG
jgi:hypothetical protein